MSPTDVVLIATITVPALAYVFVPVVASRLQGRKERNCPECRMYERMERARQDIEGVGWQDPLTAGVPVTDAYLRRRVLAAESLLRLWDEWALDHAANDVVSDLVETDSHEAAYTGWREAKRADHRP